MSVLTSSLLFAATAAAQLTTSFWILKPGLGSDKIGYYGSVIDANSSHTTLEIHYDNGTNTAALGVVDYGDTVTIGPTLYEQQYRQSIQETASNSNLYKLRCEQNTLSTTENASCTVSYGPALARRVLCTQGSQEATTAYITVTHTYSGRETYSAGVETIMRTVTYEDSRSRSTPSWCSEESAYPQEGYSSAFPVEQSNFASVQLVITAGTDKLMPTQGASASLSNATPTGTTGSPEPSGSGSGGQSGPAGGSAAPLMVVGPVTIGMITGMVAFVVQHI